MKTPLIVGALALLLLGVATTAPAQVAEEIVVAGVVVLRVRTPAGGLSIAERAQAIRQRINQALTTEDLTAANLFLQPTPGGVTIRAGRVVIVTVTAADAQAHGTTIGALAEQWLAALRAALPRAKPMNRP